MALRPNIYCILYPLLHLSFSSLVCCVLCIWRPYLGGGKGGGERSGVVIVYVYISPYCIPLTYSVSQSLNQVLFFLVCWILQRFNKMCEYTCTVSPTSLSVRTWPEFGLHFPCNQILIVNIQDGFWVVLNPMGSVLYFIVCFLRQMFEN